jgi:hypothetical protein
LAAINVAASDSVNLLLLSLGGDGDSAKISIFFFSKTTHTLKSVQHKYIIHKDAQSSNIHTGGYGMTTKVQVQI